MPSVPIEQKVRQLDNDVQALYDLVHKISMTQMRHTNRLDEITTDLAGLADRLDSVDGRLESVDGRLESVGGKVDTILDLLRAR